MNIDNIRKLAARLRSPSAEGHFNLASWFRSGTVAPRGKAIHTCGTVACIAGFAATLADPGGHPLNNRSMALDAAEWLGLDADTAKQLFEPEGVNYYKVTRFQAADVLDHLLKTGAVDWSIIE